MDIEQNAEHVGRMSTRDLEAHAALARETLLQESFASHDNYSWQKLGIAAGAGATTGAVLSASGELLLTKAVEPLAKGAGAIAFGVIGGGRAAAEIWAAPPLRAIECISPKTVLAGAAIGAALATGAYELYRGVFDK